MTGHWKGDEEEIEVSMTSDSSRGEEYRRHAAEHVEQRQRFAWLQTMIYDEGRRHRFLFVASLVLLAIVAVMAFFTFQLALLPFDLATTLTLQDIENTLFHRAMQIVSLPGFYPWHLMIIAVVSLLIAWLLGWRDAIYLVAITAFQGVINFALRIVVGRPRPSPPLVEVFARIGSNSFPSGHAMLYTVFFGFLFFLAWTRLPRSFWRALILVVTGGLVLLVGPARLYLGAHWLSDMVAGYLIGFVILAFAIELYLKYLAPSQPAETEGVVGEHERGVEIEHRRIESEG